MDKVIENNQVTLVGKITEGYTFSHEIFGEGFYMTMLEIARLSDSSDYIPVMVSDRLVDIKSDDTDSYVRVSGQFRSYNKHEENKNRLVLSVFAREFEFLTEDEIPSNTEGATNTIILDGFVCKEPIYRKTPLGREIADLLLAVNRPYGKSDYIPCICWGRNAKFAGNLTTGAHLQIVGRIQSRKYNKKISDTQVEERIAYEVSVGKLDYADEFE